MFTDHLRGGRQGKLGIRGGNFERAMCVPLRGWSVDEVQTYRSRIVTTIRDFGAPITALNGEARELASYAR